MPTDCPLPVRVRPGTTPGGRRALDATTSLSRERSLIGGISRSNSCAFVASTAACDITERSIHPPSRPLIGAPTRTGRAGSPSTAIRAAPPAPYVSTPRSVKRRAKSGSADATIALSTMLSGAPSARATMRPSTLRLSALGSTIGTGDGATASPSRSHQNTTLPTAAAQISSVMRPIERRDPRCVSYVMKQLSPNSGFTSLLF